jgi:hydrogenase maturation protease
VAEASRRRVLVIGVGNEMRGDDGAGLEVARRLHRASGMAGIDVEEEQNDPTALIERWRDRPGLVIVDAARTGAPGEIQRFDVSRHALPAGVVGSSSTHAIGVSEAIELARALGELPGNVIVLTVGGARFEAGADLAVEVAAALPGLTNRVLAEARRLAIGAPAPAQ